MSSALVLPLVDLYFVSIQIATLSDGSCNRNCSSFEVEFPYSAQALFPAYEELQVSGSCQGSESQHPLHTNSNSLISFFPELN